MKVCQTGSKGQSNYLKDCMKLLYTYKKEEDVWCLLNKGKSSNNSPTPTKVLKCLHLKQIKSTGSMSLLFECFIY